MGIRVKKSFYIIKVKSTVIIYKTNGEGTSYTYKCLLHIIIIIHKLIFLFMIMRKRTGVKHTLIKGTE